MLAEAFDGAVGQVVGDRPSGEPERNGVAAAELDAFLGEVELTALIRLVSLRLAARPERVAT